MIIEFENGKQLLNVSKEPLEDVYYSEKPFSQEDYEGSFSQITIYTEDDVVILRNRKMVVLGDIRGRFGFKLQEIPLEDLRYAQTRSDVMYIAMMTDVELGDEPMNLLSY